MAQLKLSADQKAELEMFWHWGDNYKCLRTAYHALAAYMQESDAWFVGQIKRYVPDLEPPHEKTFGRFLRAHGKQPIRDNETQLTALLLASTKLCAELEETERLKQEFANVLQLANDFSTECRSYPGLGIVSAPGPETGGRTYTIEELKQIDEAISIHSKNDPERPEFPPFNPRFPATPTIKIELDDARSVFIKDESRCPTGSHKDRWAWEKIVKYKGWIQEAILSGRPTVLRSVSMISSGSAALAMQTLLRAFDLPPLRVIVDSRMPADATRMLKARGCLVYARDDLEENFLSREAVVDLTDNASGEDITPRDILESFTHRFYDWLAYEILNESPKRIFVPVGTGDLLANIILVLGDEKNRQERGEAPDPRLRIKSVHDLLPIGVHGATTDESGTILDKLYSPFRNTRRKLGELIRTNIQSGVLLPSSKVSSVTDDQARRALSIAQENRLITEASGIAGLALFLELANGIPSAERVVVVNTGRMHIPESTRA